LVDAVIIIIIIVVVVVILLLLQAEGLTEAKIAFVLDNPGGPTRPKTRHFQSKCYFLKVLLCDIYSTYEVVSELKLSA
jgi:hypothetical protein